MTNNQQNDLSDESAKSDWPSSVNFVSDAFHEATGPHVHSSDLVGVLWAGRYEILQLLGSGGMGVVYRARNRVNGQIRAIKILHHDFLTDRDAVRRFQNEVKAAQRIHNENVIQVIDEGVGDNQVPFLVMEFVPGRSLATVLRDDRHFSLNSKLHVFLQICSALAAAHDNGVVHRDIKPSNVLIVDSPRDKYFVKVLDFGIAKLMPRSEDGTIAVTATGAVCGSPPYMSPEQCLGLPLDHRSDIYSLGCLMYEVICGAPPFSGASSMSIMYKHLNEQPLPLKGLEHDDVRLVRELDAIVQVAVSKDSGRRYQTIQELARDLVDASKKAKARSKILSELDLYVRSLKQQTSNILGSSRNAVFLLVALTLCFAIPFSYLIAPYVFVKLPEGAAIRLNWKRSPRWSNCSAETMASYATRYRGLLEQLQQPSIDPDEKCSALEQVGDMLFDDAEYQQASVRYSQLAVLASGLLTKDVPNSVAQMSHMHKSAYALSRYSRCLLHLGSYQAALAEAQVGRQASFFDTENDLRYQIYFADVIGVASLHLAGRATPQTNDYLDKFSKFIDERGFGTERASELALSFAEIGDSYGQVGQWEKAIAAYEKANALWGKLIDPSRYDRTKIANRPKLVDHATPREVGLSTHREKLAAMLAAAGDFAVYNSAISLAKVGQAKANLGDLPAAKQYLESALVAIENWQGSRTDVEVPIRSSLMKVDIAMHNYLDAWNSRVQIVKDMKTLTK